MASKSSVAEAVKGTHTLFLVTLPDFVTGSPKGTEYEHGKNVADAAKDDGVKHLLFSSLINVTEASKGKLPHVAHFDRKAEVEDYIRSRTEYTSYIHPTGVLHDQLHKPSLLRKGGDGSYSLAGPPSGTVAQLPLFFPDDDMGTFVGIALNGATRTDHAIQASTLLQPSRSATLFSESRSTLPRTTILCTASWKSSRR